MGNKFKVRGRQFIRYIPVEVVRDQFVLSCIYEDVGRGNFPSQLKLFNQFPSK